MEGSIPRSIDPLIVRALALLHADPARHWTARADRRRSRRLAFVSRRTVHSVNRLAAD
jgi:hypothetical protein